MAIIETADELARHVKADIRSAKSRGVSPDDIRGVVATSLAEVLEEDDEADPEEPEEEG